MTPSDARNANLAMVAEALERACVPYFVVRSDRSARTVVGIFAEHRERATEVLRTSLAEVACYCTPIERELAESPPVVRLFQATSNGDLTGAGGFRLWRFYVQLQGGLVYGRPYACDVEFWEPSQDNRGHRVGPQPNAISSSIPEDELLTNGASASQSRFPPVFERRNLADIDFPVDVVYTWVDDSDPNWRSKMLAAAEEAGRTTHPNSRSSERFRNRDELRYSLRSLSMYAPWVNHVYIVTDAQVPPFIDPDDKRITIVDHRDIVPDRSLLPVFNSNAIICWLHRIDQLNEHFLYVNDDMFFGRDVLPSTFFHPNGLAKVFPSANTRPLGQPSPEDEPHINLTRNIRKLIEQEFGRTVSRSIKHTPYPQRLSTHIEMVTRFRAEFDRTSQSKFRHHTDIVADQLFHYYAQLVGHAVEGSIRYSYVNVGDRGYLPVMEALLARRNRDVFCLNDAPEQGVEPMTEDEVAAFLGAYFPVPSPWERGG